MKTFFLLVVLFAFLNKSHAQYSKELNDVAYGILASRGTTITNLMLQKRDMRKGEFETPAEFNARVSTIDREIKSLLSESEEYNFKVKGIALGNYDSYSQQFNGCTVLGVDIPIPANISYAGRRLKGNISMPVAEAQMLKESGYADVTTDVTVTFSVTVNGYQPTGQIIIKTLKTYSPSGKLIYSLERL